MYLRSRPLYSFLGCLLILVSLFSRLSAGSKAEQLNSNNDHGLWLEQGLTGKVSDDWTAALFTQQRWGADYRLFWYQEYTVIFQYDLTQKVRNLFCFSDILTSVTIGPAFSQYATIRKNTLGESKWVWVSRPMVDLHIDLSWHDWQLQQRLRATYSNYNSSHYEKHGGLRYRLQLLSPWGWSCLNIKPYLSNEFFFRKNTYNTSSQTGLVGGFHQNRFRLGLMADLIEDYCSAAIYWQWRASKKSPSTHPRWWSTYQWGFALNLKI